MIKTCSFFVVLLFLCVQDIFAQITPPYTNDFDHLPDTVGWTHYAITGTDDWKRGSPGKILLSEAYTLPNGWITNLVADFAGNSNRALITPYFNLTDTTVNYALSFFQMRHSNTTSTRYYVEYSIDQGGSWILLDNASVQKKNWQGVNGFPGNCYQNFIHSSINLSFIQGQDSVLFRFRFSSGYSDGEGWLIDNFALEEEYSNIYAYTQDTIRISKNCPSFTVATLLGFYNLYSSSIYNTTNYYLSLDPVLDSLDTLIAIKAGTINWSVGWNCTIPMLSFLKAYVSYYIIFKHDALNVLAESNENDNTGIKVLIIDSIFHLPYIDDFEENTPLYIRRIAAYGIEQPLWKLGYDPHYHYEGVHSGTQQWSIFNASPAELHYIETPHFDFSTEDSVVVSLWYCNNNTVYQSIRYTKVCDFYSYDYPVGDFIKTRNGTWDFCTYYLPSGAYGNNDVRLRFYNSNGYNGMTRNIALDDLYIGHSKPDLSIERDKLNRTNLTNHPDDSIKYLLVNTGLKTADQSVTSFYWSNDSIYDSSDIWLGSKTESPVADTQRVWRYFQYTKPTFNCGKYYILYFLDTTNAIDEMREYNNSGYFVIYLDSVYTPPYSTNFENNTKGWRHSSSIGNSIWKWETATGYYSDTATFGNKCWTAIFDSTQFNNVLNRSHLYSPVFDFSSTMNPVIEFDMLNKNQGVTGNTNLSYSTDRGATWVVLDTVNQSYSRWFCATIWDWSEGHDYIPNFGNTWLLSDWSEYGFAATNIYYTGRDARHNTRFITDIGFLAGNPHVQFRFNIATTSLAGASVDNFQVRDKFIDLNVNYKKHLMISSLNHKIRFFMFVENEGNYFSHAGFTKFYLSADTIWDAGDYYLGQENVPTIRPDMKFYINAIFNGPSNLSNYKYLIYKIDATNTTVESNETNNNGYWPLSLDSISVYPYFQDFNSSIVDGWNQNNFDLLGAHMKNEWRFRNWIAPGEYLNDCHYRKGEMFTEKIDYSLAAGYGPYWYLESPVFNFEHYDSLFLSFDLMCISPGNIHFSTDGGNSWTVLTSQYGQAFNWYNYSGIPEINNEDGWCNIYNFGVLVPTSFDISFLKGQKNVVFRFKHRGSSNPAYTGYFEGMRIDNFKIVGSAHQNYQAYPAPPVINVDTALTTFALPYSIINTCAITGDYTQTSFYWSADSVFDITDQLIQTVNENPIQAFDTLFSSLNITNPNTLTQSVYYIFYKCDFGDVIAEASESDNTGRIKIVFYSSNSREDFSKEQFEVFINDESVIVISPDNILSKSQELALINGMGQVVFDIPIKIMKGTNKYTLPHELSPGIYYVRINAENRILNRKLLKK